MKESRQRQGRVDHQPNESAAVLQPSCSRPAATGRLHFQLRLSCRFSGISGVEVKDVNISPLARQSQKH